MQRASRLRSSTTQDICPRMEISSQLSMQDNYSLTWAMT